MAAGPKIYTRLTRNAAGLATYSSLWRASDHLMVVASTGYSETYARIMFRDIKAFIVTPTERRLWWGLVWGLFAAIFGIRVVMLIAYGDPPIGSAVFLGLSALALSLNWAWGRGCRVHVMTGVQTTALPALVRIKKTRAVLAQLQPLIAAAQADRMATHVEPAGATTPPSDGTKTQDGAAATPPPEMPATS